MDVKTLLAGRGVRLWDVTQIVYEVQKSYLPNLTMADCLESVEAVLSKREVQNVLYTGVALDQLAEQNLLPEPLQLRITSDHALFGVDEVLATGITNMYGTIGFTNFGYLDKLKTGIIGRLHQDQVQVDGRVNTFLDDLVAAVAASAAARLAHTWTY